MRARRPVVEIDNGIARKKGEGRALSIEAAKTRAANLLGEASGLFRAPTVVGLDGGEGILELQYFLRFRSLQSLAVMRDPRLPELLARAGRALRATHKSLKLDPAMYAALPAGLMPEGGSEVFIHGDFTGYNVGVDEETGDLVVLDWSCAPLIDGQPTVGPAEFDVVWFSHSWFLRVSRRRIAMSRADLADAFLRGYVEQDTPLVTRESFIAYRSRVEDMTATLRQLTRARLPRYKRGAYRAAQAWLAFKWRNYDPIALVGHSDTSGKD